MKEVNYSVFTDIGDREVNEDTIKVVKINDGYGFIVCDGLGGHGMGDKASSLVTSVFEDCVKKESNKRKTLELFFEKAQQDLLDEQAKAHAETKMKTTAVTLLIDKRKAYIGYIGDSRLYVFANNEVYKRTIDHSVPQMLALAHEIEDSEIRHHPDRNLILRVLGTEWGNEKYEIWKPIPLRKCQAFLLCSDGFWEMIEESYMCEYLKKSNSVNEWLEQMIDHVKRHGAGVKMDNNSAIAVWCN